jgi:hypothetical protein
MDYELRTIPGCSNSRPALELFRRVLAAEGADERNPRTVELTSESEAEELDFHGSPSFIADGRYLFTSTASPALTCRVYPSKIGLTGLPSLEDLRAAVRARSSEDGIPG